MTAACVSMATGASLTGEMEKSMWPWAERRKMLPGQSLVWYEKRSSPLACSSGTYTTLFWPVGSADACSSVAP